jgi:hypothetical protein
VLNVISLISRRFCDVNLMAAATLKRSFTFLYILTKQLINVLTPTILNHQ